MNNKKMKTMLSLATAVVTIAISGYYGSNAMRMNISAENHLLANVEALSGTKPETGSDCSGYREWSTSGFLQSKKEFYDCTCTLRSGYSPKGNCN